MPKYHRGLGVKSSSTIATPFTVEIHFPHSAVARLIIDVRVVFNGIGREEAIEPNMCRKNALIGTCKSRKMRSWDRIDTLLVEIYRIGKKSRNMYRVKTRKPRRKNHRKPRRQSLENLQGTHNVPNVCFGIRQRLLKFIDMVKWL